MARYSDYVPLGEKPISASTSTRSPWLHRIAIALTGALALSGVHRFSQTIVGNAADGELAVTRYQEPEAIRPQSYLSDSSALEKILHDPEFRNQSLKAFQGALQIETESYDDNPDPADDMTPWTKFYAFHDYLKETYPLIYKNLEVETVNNVNLLYTWKGSDPSLKPLMLTAHQDVVPVDAKSAEEWTYEPYSAYFDGKDIWARGSQDCKNLLIAELGAVEELLRVGFKPKRTILLAFGHDEESGGLGAGHLNITLTERYGENSLYAILDEGTPMISQGGEWFALPAVSEKGHLDIIIQLTMNGGHSSMPPDHTAIGIMSELITTLEANPFKPYLSNDSPVMQLLATFAEAIEDMPKDIKKAIMDAPNDPKAKDKVLGFLATRPDLKFLVQTSQAVDIIHGGVKSNALPEFVTLLINHRIALHSNIKETMDRLFSYLTPLAEKYDLDVFYEDAKLTGEVSSTIEKGYFNVSTAGPIEALPLSPSSGPVWDLLAGTLKHVFEDLVLEDGKKVYIAPSILVGNTDTKRYTYLTENIYRFQATRMMDANTGLHSLNEHIGLDQHLETMAFLYEFIQNVDEATD